MDKYTKNFKAKGKYIYPGGWQKGAMVIQNDYLWIVHGHLNILFKINTLTGEVIEEKIIDDEISVTVCSYSNLIMIDKLLYLIPYSSQGIKVYDIEKNIFRKYSDDDLSCITNIQHIVKINKYQYCLIDHKCEEDILIVDLCKRMIVNKIHTGLDAENKNCFGATYSVINEKVYLPMYVLSDERVDKTIGEIDIKQGCFTRVYLTGDIKGLEDFAVVGDQAYFSGAYNLVTYIFDKKTWVLKETIEHRKRILGIAQEKIVLEDYENGDIFLLDNKCMKKVFISNPDVFYKGCRYASTFSEIKDGYLIFQRKSGSILIFSKKWKLVRVFNPNYCMSNSSLLVEGNTYCESFFLDLNDFIDMA